MYNNNINEKSSRIFEEIEYIFNALWVVYNLFSNKIIKKNYKRNTNKRISLFLKGNLIIKKISYTKEKKVHFSSF